MSKRKAISISLAKIDYNHGKPHLYMIADCPRGYVLTHMGITVSAFIDNKWEDQHYTVDDWVDGHNDIVLNVPLSILEGANSPAIYHIYLQAELENEHPIKDELLLSDVYGVYRNMLDSILENDSCTGMPDDVIKNYLILHAHQLALNNNDLLVAKDMFKLLHNLPCNKKSTNKVNCGCHDKR